MLCIILVQGASMPLRKSTEEEVRALCAAVHSDDGVNPRDEKRSVAHRNQATDHKQMQFCKQVANALHLALPASLITEGASLFGVEPAPNAGRLRVVVEIARNGDRYKVEQQLNRSASFLRTELARSISRRRVPVLVFLVKPKEGDDG
jgi:ribosome-binding factor A